MLDFVSITTITKNVMEQFCNINPYESLQIFEFLLQNQTHTQSITSSTSLIFQQSTREKLRESYLQLVICFIYHSERIHGYIEVLRILQLNRFKWKKMHRFELHACLSQKLLESFEILLQMPPNLRKLK